MESPKAPSSIPPSDERPHLFEFVRRGSTVIHSNDGLADGSMSDVGDDVLADSGALQLVIQRGEVEVARTVNADDARRDALRQELRRRGARRPRRH